jgi:hypothetical protein
MDVAILLNLTGRLTFEVTDPLMSIINASKPLLFYDRLSVVQFPTDPAMCQEHVERLASSMRNLLEARTLSATDENEKIRLIITLDFAGGAFQPEDESKLFFPAQKARQFKKTIENIFEIGNPILNRFEYVFIFISNQNNDIQENNFYQNLCYDGWGGNNGENWFSKEDLDLNTLREKIIKDLKTPHDEWLLTRKNIKPEYDKFINHQDKILKKVAYNMEKAGLKNEFETLFGAKTKEIKTIGDFNTFDYDGEIMACVSQLIGLCANDFQNDCTFIILPRDNSTLQMRHKSEIFVSSIVQLLATLSNDNYNTILKTNVINSPARLYYLSTPNINDVNNGAFLSLGKQVQKSLVNLELTRWQLDKNVVDYIQYTPKSQDPKTTDTHRELNDKLTEQRQSMYDEFVKIRKVPFFFGKHIGDWIWYKHVVNSMETIFNFESVNDRPLYDLPKRITDNEMDQTRAECTYADLDNTIITLSKNLPEIKKEKDFNDYLKERKDLMESMSGAMEKLKKEMVKLGYFSCLFWIGFFATIAFTTIYTFHYFWYDIEDDPWLIAVCWCAAVALFAISAVVGQVCIKSKIKRVHNEIDYYFYKMQDNLQSFLNEISERVKMQDEADIRRKNLDEMNSKMDAFYRHNKQIDIWTEHYKSIIEKTTAILQSLKVNQDFVDERGGNPDEDDFDLTSTIPSLPDAIRNSFINMSTVFSNKEISINNITCFVNYLRFSEHNG